MIHIPFEQLFHTDFLISEPLAKPQYWMARGNLYNALGKPKVSHTLLWFKNCDATIELPNKERIVCERNSLFYMSKGIEYAVHFHHTNEGTEDTIVVHFQMTDRNGEDICPIDRPIVCLKSVDSSTAMLLDSMAEECKRNLVCLPEISSGVYKLISIVCRKQKSRTTKNHFARIRRGIELLEGENELSIAEIAEECGVSECYFRRLFQAYSGESPMQFRQKARIERAKQLLLSDEHYTISEIASELNFLDVYHFSKTFKKFCGVSPNKFQRSAEAE